MRSRRQDTPCTRGAHSADCSLATLRTTRTRRYVNVNMQYGSTSVERRQWSAVSGAPSMERELIERRVGRAPSVER